MEPVVIRPAQPSDATDLARNWIDVAGHYVELDADAFQLPATGGLVAEVDGRVVGDAAARLEHPTEDATRQLLRDLDRVRLYVDALGVAEACRRRGVGARLLHAVEAWGGARARSATC